MHAKAIAIPKPAVTSTVQAQGVAVAIPAVAPVEDTYTFSPQHDSAFNYWVDAQHDDFADCRVVIDGVKAVSHKGALVRIKESVVAWLLKKELAFGALLKKRQEQRERVFAEQNKKPTVTADPSVLRTVVLTTGQVGIGAVAGYLLFRMGLSVVKSIEKKRHTHTITFDEE